MLIMRQTFASGLSPMTTLYEPFALRAAAGSPALYKELMVAFKKVEPAICGSLPTIAPCIIVGA
jgi:hypothetical protein